MILSSVKNRLKGLLDDDFAWHAHDMFNNLQLHAANASYSWRGAPQLSLWSTEPLNRASWNIYFSDWEALRCQQEIDEISSFGEARNRSQ